MKRWEAIDDHGNPVNEDEINWDLVKDRVSQLSLRVGEQTITLPKDMDYIQGKSASASLGSSQITVESRYIGLRIRNNIVKIRVDEKTNNISIEVENDPTYIPNSGE